MTFNDCYWVCCFIVSIYAWIMLSTTYYYCAMLFMKSVKEKNSAIFEWDVWKMNKDCSKCRWFFHYLHCNLFYFWGHFKKYRSLFSIINLLLCALKFKWAKSIEFLFKNCLTKLFTSFDWHINSKCLVSQRNCSTLAFFLSKKVWTKKELRANRISL